MIKSLTVTNFLGDRIRLDLRKPEATGFLIKSITGLGPAKANINTMEMTTNDGSVLSSARLSQRNIVIQLIFVDSIYGENIEDIRQKSYLFFPIKKKVEITVETENRLVRATGFIESNEPDIFSKQEGTQISIICPDPYFYSESDGNYSVANFYNVYRLFEFPFENDSSSSPSIVFSDIVLKNKGVIVYDGDLEVGLMFYIDVMQNTKNITITNVKTSESIQINSTKIEQIIGSSFVTGDRIMLNTSKGQKSIFLVRNGMTYNILNCLEKNATWLSINKGDNIFEYTTENDYTDIILRMEYKTIYEGV